MEMMVNALVKTSHHYGVYQRHHWEGLSCVQFLSTTLTNLVLDFWITTLQSSLLCTPLRVYKNHQFQKLAMVHWIRSEEWHCVFNKWAWFCTAGRPVYLHIDERGHGIFSVLVEIIARLLYSDIVAAPICTSAMGPVLYWLTHFAPRIMFMHPNACIRHWLDV